MFQKVVKHWTDELKVKHHQSQVNEPHDTLAESVLPAYPFENTSSWWFQAI